MGNRARFAVCVSQAAVKGGGCARTLVVHIHSTTHTHTHIYTHKQTRALTHMRDPVIFVRAKVEATRKFVIDDGSLRETGF